MESQGENNDGSPLITRRVEASSDTWLNRTRQTERSGGGEPEIAVQLRCHVIKHIRAGHGRQVHVYRGSDIAEAIYVAAVPRYVPVEVVEDTFRDVMRLLLRAIRPLRDLDLTDDEWEAILPEDVVAELADLARGLGEGSRAALAVELAVDRHVSYSEPRVLMTACKEAAAAAPEGKKGGDCSICFEPLREEKAPMPVELPGCAHAFHRRCISKWFRKKPTCPMCRGDVTKHLEPELQKDILEFNSHCDNPDPRTAIDSP